MSRVIAPGQPADSAYSTSDTMIRGIQVVCHKMLFPIIVTLLLSCCDAADIQEYMVQRARLIANDSSLSIGGKSTLNSKESHVNKCLMQHKCQELDYDFTNPQYFNFSRHFFEYKHLIPKSKVYQIIKDMPKGGVLHVHDMGILGPEYLLNLTYMDHLYVCFDNKLHLKFADKPPKDQCKGTWLLMSEARKAASDVRKFDEELTKHFTIEVDNPDVMYPSITESWKAFMKYFGTVTPLLAYRPVWEQYFYDVLQKLRNDNIMYVEVRSILPNLYELDGTTYDQLITAKSYKKAIKSFVKDHPDFFGARLIYAPARFATDDQLKSYIRTAKLIKQDIPDIFVGFDLVGQEDLGRPLVDFAGELLDASNELNYFFHAGETDWSGTSTDYNLVDAILLGAKRIGHAYALVKHPLLMDLVREMKIGVEVNVISNEVLSLVRDIRNHPLSTFIASDIPVVLSSDDPGAWGADIISYDYYVAFVGVASKNADLRLLKSLALNSLQYSALDEHEKSVALRNFNVKWNHFVSNFDCYKYAL